jgi:UDPglucose 6-dehydrogenase
VNVTVYGLWHLGCVTAACVAAGGQRVVGLDPDASVVARLHAGHAPLFEPGLDDEIAAGLRSGALTFTTDAAAALRHADVLWVTFDTPVDEHDHADVEFVRARVESVRDDLRPGTLVLVSSQVPVGFTRELERRFAGRGVTFACSPENLRLGRALDAFRRAERTVVGLRSPNDRARLEALLGPFCARLEWTSVESAEMSKHALNAFLATSATFANELARLCEALGADAREVERALKSEPRIGARAYLAPGAPLAGGTLARDLRYLAAFGRELGIATPLVDGVIASNERQRAWLCERVLDLLGDAASAVVAVLGLTYTPGTDTLRRSSALELCAALVARGLEVRAHDPAVTALPEGAPALRLCATPAEALAGADVAVIATAWPEFKELRAGDFVRAMRAPRVVDPGWFLADNLGADARVTYVAPGRPSRREEP